MVNLLVCGWDFSRAWNQKRVEPVCFCRSCTPSYPGSSLWKPWISLARTEIRGKCGVFEPSSTEIADGDMGGKSKVKSSTCSLLEYVINNNTTWNIMSFNVCTILIAINCSYTYFLMHLCLQNSNTTLNMWVFFAIKILEMGVFFMLRNPLKGGLSQCHFRVWEYKVYKSEPPPGILSVL